MVHTEKEPVSIDQLRRAFSDEAFLVEVTAYDPDTRAPSHGVVLASSKSRFVAEEARLRASVNRNGRSGLELIVFQGNDRTLRRGLVFPDITNKVRGRFSKVYRI
jgi:hypothetical protein